MVALDGFQVSEAADGQPVFVVFSLIDHGVDMLGEDLPRLHDHGPLALLQLSVNRKRALDGGRGDNPFNRIVRGMHPRLKAGMSVARASRGRLHGRWLTQRAPFRQAFDLYSVALGP